MCVKEEIRSKTCIVRKEEYRPDEQPPWVGMAFESPLGSDDLFFHLKDAYPEGQNLLQRKVCFSDIENASRTRPNRSIWVASI